MMAFLYASPSTYGMAGARLGVIDELNKLRGHQVVLYRPQEPALVCVLLDVREIDKKRPPLFVDPHVADAAPEDVDRLSLRRAALGAGRAAPDPVNPAGLLFVVETSSATWCGLGAKGGAKTQNSRISPFHSSPART
jgi:hypothetical protein